MKLSNIQAINVYRKFPEENTTDFDHANLWGESQGPGGGGTYFLVYCFNFILPCETNHHTISSGTIHSCCFHQDRKLLKVTYEERTVLRVRWRDQGGDACVKSERKSIDMKGDFQSRK